MRSTLLIVCGLGLSSIAHADLMFGPDHFIGESLKAHGGDKVDKYRAESFKQQGKIFLNGKEVDFTGEFLIQLPSQYKTVMRYELDGVKTEMLSVVNGDKGWTKQDGKTSEMPASAMKEIKASLYSKTIRRLSSLVQDRTFQLTNLNQASNPSMIDGVRAWRIGVSKKGEIDVTLWIADQSRLLLREEYLFQTDDNKPTKWEKNYGDYKEINGVQWPTRRTFLKNGLKSLDAKATDIKLLEQIDEKEFAKP